MHSAIHVSTAFLIVGISLLSIGFVLLVIAQSGLSPRFLAWPRRNSSIMILLGLTLICFGNLSNHTHQDRLLALVAAIENNQGYETMQLIKNDPTLLLEDVSQIGNGDPLLHRVIHKGHLPMMLMILSEPNGYRVNLEAKDRQGRTALILALEEKQLFMVSFLLSHGARTDVRDAKNQTAIQLAQALGPEYTRLFECH